MQQLQIMNTFQITYQLGTVYPDVQDELCSKHTIQLNQVHKCFGKCYPATEPSHFVIANKHIALVQGSASTLTMAMEHGVTLLLSGGTEEDDLNIAGNLFSEVLMEKSGKAINIEQEPQFSALAKRAIELAVDDLSLNKIKGGFIYLHIHDGETVDSLKRQVVLSLFTAILMINGILQEYTIEELVTKLKTLPEFQNNRIVENYLMNHNNRHLLVSNAHSGTSIQLDQKNKFLFLNLQFLSAGMQGFETEEALCLEKFDESIGLFEEEKIDLAEFMRQIAEIQLSVINKDEVVHFVQNLVEKFKFKAFLFFKGYCVFLVENYRYAEVIGRLSKIVHETLATKSLALVPEPLYQKSQPSKMRAMLFTSVPSSGLSILDPSTSLWF